MEELRKCLCNRVISHVHTLSDSFVLYTDVSGDGLGACLHVVREEEELPVAFYSRQLQEAETKYTVPELEALAIVATIQHFEFYLYGAPVVVFTYHKACTSLLMSTHLNKRLMRLALKLQGMVLDIQYCPGKENGSADGLSQQGWKMMFLWSPVQVFVRCTPTGAVLAGGPVGSVGPDFHWKYEDQDKD